MKLHDVDPGPFFRGKSLEQHVVLQTLSSSRKPPSINSSDFRFRVVFNHLLVLIVVMAVSLIWISMQIGRSFKLLDGDNIIDFPALWQVNTIYVGVDDFFHSAGADTL